MKSNKELISTIEQLQRNQEQLQQKHEREMNELKQQLEVRLKKDRNEEELKKSLKVLRYNFTIESQKACKVLQTLYAESEKVILDRTFIRRAYQLSILGILWTEPMLISSVGNAVDEKNNLETLSLSVQGQTHWMKVSENTRSFLLDWIEKFCECSLVKPEALVSQNLWGFIIRSILMSFESTCSAHEESNRLQCFPEYNTKNIASLNGAFFTDFVYLPGSKGLPLFMVEICARKDTSSADYMMHKDFKKLAVQLSSILMLQIGIIRGDEKMKQLKKEAEMISGLKVFGVLISGFEIEFCVCRPVIEPESPIKFHFVMETHREKWTFDLFNANIAIPENLSIVELSHINVEKSITTEREYQEIDYIDIEHQFTDEFELELIDSAKKRLKSADELPARRVNLNALDAISEFIFYVHKYYTELDEALKAIILNPEDFDRDETLVYPHQIHDCFSTTGTRTPNSNRETFSTQFTANGYKVRSDCPTDFIFATLPFFLQIKEDPDDEFYRFDIYAEGTSFDVMHDMVENEPSRHLAKARVHAQCAMILGIVMGLYEAFQAGFVFDHFSSEDICFRDGLYCLKTYSHVRPATSCAELVESVLKFFRFLLCTYHWQNTFCNGDSDYDFLFKVRGAFGIKLREAQSSNHSESFVNWKDLFVNAKNHYEEMLHEFHIRNDRTQFFLNNFVESIGEERKRSIFKDHHHPLKASGSSSIETMPIEDENEEEEDSVSGKTIQSEALSTSTEETATEAM